MLELPVLNDSNEKILCERNGKNSDMLMTIRVKYLKAGESISFCEKEDETAVLLVAGAVTFEWNGNKESGKRKDPFEMKPYCLHASKNTQFTVTADEDSEIVIQQTDNEKEFAPVFYNPDNCLYQEFGKGQWDGAGHRVVSTMFDPDNAPYSNMVMGEVFNKPGRWSSYPPHHHPQPEVYYYQFDKPQGFGACFIGDNVFKSTEGSACFITDGYDHQQVVAPGYEMCYIWMIRHLDNDTWYKTTRFVSKEHQWLTKQ